MKPWPGEEDRLCLIRQKSTTKPYWVGALVGSLSTGASRVRTINAIANRKGVTIFSVEWMCLFALFTKVCQRMASLGSPPFWPCQFILVAKVGQDHGHQFGDQRLAGAKFWLGQCMVHLAIWVKIEHALWVCLDERRCRQSQKNWLLANKTVDVWMSAVFVNELMCAQNS